MSHGLSDAVASGRTILVPNVELATALLDAVERQMSAATQGVWPTPRVRDFGGWLREQYERRQLLDATSPRLLGDSEERELWRSVLLGDAAAQFLLEPNGAARAARAARRALIEFGIPLAAVARTPTEETDAFLRWHTAFEQRCRVLHCIAADQALLQVADAQAPLAWIDNPAWRPVARAWLQDHVGAALRAPGGACDRVRHVRAESAAGELAAGAEWAAEHLRHDPNFRAWICIPDLAQRREAVVAAFDAVLAPQRFALVDDARPALYAIAGGTALIEYAPVRAALDVLNAASGPVTFEECSALLRMPALQLDRADAGRATRIELELRRRGTAQAPLRQWLALIDEVTQHHDSPPAGAAVRLRAAADVLDGCRSPLLISQWVEAWIEAWHRGPWAAAPQWSSAEFQAAMRFRELLGSLAMADRVFGPLPRPAALGMLNRTARDTLFQPQTGVPPIWISSQLQDPWLRYDGLWVTRCGEDAWPPPISPVPLLPVVLQRSHGVTSAGAATQLEFARLLQSRWLERARECVFSCAAVGDGDGAALSPILPPPTVAPTVALTEPLPARPQPLWHELQACAPRLERVSDVRGPAFVASERTRGVATLRAQSACAFQGFAHTRLHVARLDKPVPGFNEAERGDMVHFALEYIWRELRDWHRLQTLAADAQAQLIDTAALRAIERRCRRRDPGGRWRERERVRLGQLLAKWLDAERERAPFSVLEIEAEARSVRYAGLPFSVRIDRIDRLDDGSRVLIDYKTGNVAPDWRGERPINPQLPIYALCEPHDLIAVAYGRVNAGDCQFVAESARSKVFVQHGSGVRATKLEGMATFADLVTLWAVRVEELARRLAQGDAEVAPLPQACKHCGLQVLCRVRSALDEGQGDE